MPPIFIADLHLSPHTPVLVSEFLRVLKTYAAPNTQLYILGDFFDVYLGPDIETAFQENIAQAMREAVHQGLDIYFMVGNRDFLVNQDFLNLAKAKALPDPALIIINNQKILLKHGDDLCTQDKRHQIFRKLTRRPRIKKLFLNFPKTWRQAIANKIRHVSRGHQHKYLNITDVDLKTITRTLAHHQTHTLIHGHTHRPGIQHWGDNLTRYILPDWRTKAKGLIIQPDKRWELADL